MLKIETSIPILKVIKVFRNDKIVSDVHIERRQ